MNSIVSVATLFVSAGFLAVAALAACSDGSTGTPAPTPTEKSDGDARGRTPLPTPVVDVPVPTAAPVATIVAGPAAPSALSATFAARCAVCHGKDAEGKGPNPRLIGLTLTEADFIAIVEQGRGRMPAIKFPANELEARTLELKGDYAVLSAQAAPSGTPLPGSTPASTPVPGVTPAVTPVPSATPAVTPEPTPIATAMPLPLPIALSADYATNCAGCHGDTGEGIAGFSPRLIGTALTAEQFLSVVRKGKGAMPAFARSDIPDDSVFNDHAFFSSVR